MDGTIKFGLVYVRGERAQAWVGIMTVEALCRSFQFQVHNINSSN